MTGRKCGAFHLQKNPNFIAKITFIALCCVALSACTSNNTNKPDVTATTLIEQTASTSPTASPSPSPSPAPDSQKVVFENDAFKIFEPAPNSEVGTTFKVRGRARVFEAAFSYKFEDGHNVLAEGNVKADAGAPEWGEFEFTVTSQNATNPTGVLIIYEASAKDGSPTNQLMLPLKFKPEAIERLQ
jgi:hypothetical protein